MMIQGTGPEEVMQGDGQETYSTRAMRVWPRTLLMSVSSETDNAGAVDRKGVDGPEVWKRMSAGMRFLFDNNSKSPFFDLELIGVQRSCSEGHCRSVWKHQRYRYREGRYVTTPLGTSPE